jgi:hypothetical protein
MRLERSREFTVNMGAYESVKFGARVALTDEEAANIPNVQAYMETLLDGALQRDLEWAEKYTGKEDSFVLTWNATR